MYFEIVKKYNKLKRFLKTKFIKLIQHLISFFDVSFFGWIRKSRSFARLKTSWFLFFPFLHFPFVTNVFTGYIWIFFSLVKFFAFPPNFSRNFDFIILYLSGFTIFNKTRTKSHAVGKDSWLTSISDIYLTSFSTSS